MPISYEIEAKGIPRPEVTWLLNGTPIKADSRLKITDSGEKYKLDIVDVKMADQGEYKAVVKNRIGERVLTANLEVIRKFEINLFEHLSLI